MLSFLGWFGVWNSPHASQISIAAMIVKPQKSAKKPALAACFSSEMGFVFMSGYPNSTEATQGVLFATQNNPTLRRYRSLPPPAAQGGLKPKPKAKT